MWKKAYADSVGRMDKDIAAVSKPNRIVGRKGESDSASIPAAATMAACRIGGPVNSSASLDDSNEATWSFLSCR